MQYLHSNKEGTARRANDSKLKIQNMLDITSCDIIT